MINIRKLAAVDMAWNGTRFILAEFAIGIVGPLLLGFLSLRAGLFAPVRTTWEWLLGLWLVTIGVNYVPLFIYAVLIARGGTVKEEGLPEIAQARRYGVQQAMILVPLMVVIVALLQEVLRR